jgi:hypothetical protein
MRTELVAQDLGGPAVTYVYECRIRVLDGLLLILACTGFAIALPPLIYIAALGHLLVSFVFATSKWIWISGATIVVTINAALVSLGIYAVQRFYYGQAADAAYPMVQYQWLNILASAVILSRVIGFLFSQPTAVAVHNAKLKPQRISS